MPISQESATVWAETVLRVLQTPFPYAAGHVTRDPGDTDVRPAVLHPAFHGSLDWHSSVHMQWSALRLRPLVSPGLRDRLTALLDDRLTADHLATETRYLQTNPGYERPYGWAWALLLAAEARRSGSPQWADGLAGLALVITDHLTAWLPRLAYPVRHGVHANTAFALGLAWDAAPTLHPLITERVEDWFAADTDAPVGYEPSGEDFLSSSLCEADLMRRVRSAATFGDWLAGFLPHLGTAGDPLLEVPVVLDHTDGKAVHLFGLSLSRAGQLRRVAAYLPAERADRCRAAADAQLAAIEAQISDGDFMATHWLVSFALLAEQNERPT